METYWLPWRFFRRRLTLLVELLLVVAVVGFLLPPTELKPLFGLAAGILGVLATMGYLEMLRCGGVRRVSLSGLLLIVEERDSETAIDLTDISRAQIRHSPWGLPVLELEQRRPRFTHSIPLVGEAGERIVEHVIEQVPSDAYRAQNLWNKRPPYRPGLFRPTDETIPLQGAK